MKKSKNAQYQSSIATLDSKRSKSEGASRVLFNSDVDVFDLDPEIDENDADMYDNPFQIVCVSDGQSIIFVCLICIL